MSEKYAVLIAVDNFPDEGLPPVPFAEADARALAAALEAVGFAKANQTLLLGGGATKTTVESRLRKLAKALKPEDTLFLFYAGRGFSDDEGSYLAAADTQAADLPPTGIALRDLWKPIRASGCGRVVLFLDAGACEPTDELPEDVEPHLSAGELEELFGASDSALCFLASKPEEPSYPASGLKHRAWGYHLIEALSGNAPEALVDDGLITAASLQAYLEQEVPRTLRKVLAGPAQQTPTLFGQARDALLADVRPALAKKQTAEDLDLQQLKRVVFRAETTGRVKGLAGFQKHFRVPDQVSPASEKFVARAAAEDIKADVEETFNAIRENFGFKRKDLEATAERDGHGFIRTPTFDYSVGVRLDPADPASVIWRREVSNIQDADLVRSRGFQAVFGSTFDTLVFEFSAPLDIEELVDRIEEEGAKGIKVRVAPDSSACEIGLDGFRGAIKIEQHCLFIEGRSSQSAGSLVDQFFEFQKRFTRSHDLPALR